MHKPLLESKQAIPDGVVIVIDALDECDDNYSVHLLLDVLLRFIEQLPVKFFVASRPESVIGDRMLSQGGSSRLIVYLHDIEESIVGGGGDIKKYLTEALISMKPPPSPTQIELLAKRSRNLFIYAATVVRYIYPDEFIVDSSARLELMLDTIGASNGIAALESRLSQDEKDYMRRVLWTVVCAREPIFATTIAFLATLTERQVMSALQLFRSVLHIPENSSLISPLHTSFPEYMLARSRSKRFYCNELKSNEMLTRRCFEIMKSELRFNICGLETSYLTDDKVLDLDARVARCISSTLSYACRHWSSHLRLAPTTDDTADMLFDLLSNRLLFWMEVMSLSRCIGVGAPMMQQAQTWLQPTENKQDTTQKQVSDGRNFIAWFAASPCSQSTPHIYNSALAFCARSSWVHQHYSKRTQGLACVLASKHDESMLAIWNVSYTTFSLAISPNGALIAGPFRGHTDQVYSVTFCPNGVHIATSSYDKTVIVWDALNGRVVTGPLRKHTRSVNSVAFAPDGIRLVSGSSDETVIVWDISTGDIALGPLIRERKFYVRQEQGRHNNSDFGNVLKMLWIDVVKPILDSLGYTTRPLPGILPHITWCPTGIASFLPLQAAGDYDQQHLTIFDYAVSSYTPTLSALLNSNTSTLDCNSRVLAVGQAATPDHAPLPGTTTELEYVKSSVEKRAGYSELMDTEATPETVLDAMEKHDWVHLACHAHQNVYDPTKSGFFLHGGTLDLAAINRRSFKKKGLAFLSACQTATGDETLPDEAVHLASGMLMAGYSSVIATMWSVGDAEAPFVADKVYNQLMKQGTLGNGEAGRALHYAVEELRMRVGEREFGRWVPFIHIGS